MRALPPTPGKADEFKWLDDLNPSQRSAVVHESGPLLVVAGAGSGKTRTLAYRVAWLLAKGVAPERVMLLTFTRRAAEEMLKRAEIIIRRGAGVAGRVWGGTFHATANRLLRKYARLAGLDPAFTVIDEADSEDLMNMARHDLGYHRKEKRFPRKGTCLAIYSRTVNGTEPFETVLKKYFPWCAEWRDDLKALFKEYVDRKQQRHVLDYDDLLLYWARMLRDDEIARRLCGLFDHILVDEYQDTNSLQADILRGMRKFNNNITAVGDDCQSIYSFRAATVRNMLDFPKHFPGTTIVTLDQNYRSTQPILNATNRLIAGAAERYSKNLWTARKGGQKPRLVTCSDEFSQNEYVVSRILQHYEEGIPLRRQAVLFRVGHLSNSLEVELQRRNVPYRKYGGLRFLEAAHVKDLVAFLRVLENPRDELAWFRILQLMDGVGPSTAGKAILYVRNRDYDPRSVAEFPAPASAREQMQSFARMAREILSPNEPLSVSAQIGRIRRFYDPLLEKRYENPDVRMRDIENLETISSNYRSRRSFLNDIQIDPPSSTSDLAANPDLDEDWLVLSTIHSAKGCEWDAVYLIHAADGWLPSDLATGSREEIEEERRLAYVALTRARDCLYVTWPLRYYHKRGKAGDTHNYAQISRFFTDAVRSEFEIESFGRQRPDDDAEPGTCGESDIPSSLREMWT